jgi:hypothetical protein
MNKPLLKPHRRFQPLTQREWLFALMALGCAGGWIYERVDNRPPQDVQAVMEGMKEMRRNPEARVRVVVNFNGKYPIVCDMSRLATLPPQETPPK